MMAARLAAFPGAEFPRMSSMSGAEVLPEVQGPGIPASGQGSLHSSLCYKDLHWRWAGHGRSIRAEGRDLGSPGCWGDLRVVQGGLQDIRGHGGRLGGRAWRQEGSLGSLGQVQEGHQRLQQGRLEKNED